MELDRRDRAAAAIAAIALIVGIGVLTLWRNPPMATLGTDAAGHLVVESVDPYGTAARDGIVAGMLVIEANGVPVIRFPEYIYPDPDPETGEVTEEPIGVEPAWLSKPVSTTSYQRAPWAWVTTPIS